MIDLEKLKADIDSVLDLQDTQQIDKIKEIKLRINDVSNEIETLIQDKHDLTLKYREAVMNSPLKPNDSVDEKGGANQTGKTWEQIVEEFNLSKGN